MAKRAQCNVPQLFEDLAKVVQADVDSAKRHVSEGSFTFERGPANNSFLVKRHKPGSDSIVHEARRFCLSGGCIEVLDKASRRF